MMKRIIIFIFIFVIMSQGWAQTNSLYFTKNIFQTTELNPARQLKCKFSLGIPVLSATYVDLLNRNFTYNDLFLEDITLPDSLRYTPDIDNFYDALNENNYIFINNKISLGSMGFWINDAYVYFDVNMNTSSNINIPKSLFLLKDGNFFTDSSYFSASNLAINMSSYTEFALGVAQEVIPGLVVGAKFKIYAGIANLTTSNFQLDWHVSTSDTSNYSYTLNTGYEIHSSSPLKLIPEYDSLNNITGISTPNLDQFSDFPGYYKLDNIFDKYNFGLGIDLGIIYNLNDKFEFSASVIDFGFISWQNNSLSLTAEEQEFVFSGLELEKYLGDNSIFDLLSNSNLTDSIISGLQNDFIDTMLTLTMPKVDSSRYTQNLNTKIHLAAAYTPTDWFSLGVLYNGMFFNKKLISSYSFSSTLSFAKAWSYSINYTIFSQSFNNLGMGLAWKIGPFQTYLFMDNISIPALAARYGLYPDKLYNEGIATNWVKSTRMINLQFGINLVFGCKENKDFGLID